MIGVESEAAILSIRELQTQIKHLEAEKAILINECRRLNELSVLKKDNFDELKAKTDLLTSKAEEEIKLASITIKQNADLRKEIEELKQKNMYMEELNTRETKKTKVLEDKLNVLSDDLVQQKIRLAKYEEFLDEFLQVSHQPSSLTNAEILIYQNSATSKERLENLSHEVQAIIERLKAHPKYIFAQNLDSKSDIVKDFIKAHEKIDQLTFQIKENEARRLGPGPMIPMTKETKCLLEEYYSIAEHLKQYRFSKPK